MLHVKQPHPDRASHAHHRQLNQQVGLDAENPAQTGGQSKDCQIRPIHRVTLTRAGLGLGEPLPDHKHEQRRNDEQNDRVARQPVGEAPPAGGLQILLDG